MINDYYHILGVQRGDSKDKIKRAFREKAKLYHPDINKAPDSRKKFLEVHEAYAVLIGKKKVRRAVKKYQFTSQAPADPDHYQWWLKELKRRANQQRKETRSYIDPAFARFQKSQRKLADVFFYSLLGVLTLPVFYLIFIYVGEVIRGYTQDNYATSEPFYETSFGGFQAYVPFCLMVYAFCMVIFFVAIYRRANYGKRSRRSRYRSL